MLIDSRTCTADTSVASGEQSHETTAPTRWPNATITCRLVDGDLTVTLCVVLPTALWRDLHSVRFTGS